MLRRFRVVGRLVAAISLLAAMAHPISAQTEVQLAAGDTVAFSLLGAPDLGRQATIGGDGTVYLPLAGKVAAAGLSVDELRESINAVLRDRAYRVSGPGGEDVWRRVQEDDIFLDIAEYRPVYITGDVGRPGEIRYRPGMSVRQALAIAGGVGRLAEDDREERILRLSDERGLLMGRIGIQNTELARLGADLEAVLALRFPDPDGPGTQPLGGDSPSELEALAQRWLAARSELRESAESGNRLALSRMESRLEVLEELDAASRENLQFEEEEFVRAEEAAAFRPGPENLRAAADARRGLLQSSTRALETASELLRLKLDMARFSEETKADIINEQTRLLEAISSGTENLHNMERQRRLIDNQLIRLGAMPTGSQEASVEMRLFRADSDATGGEAALPEMTMMPGDVLEVTLTLTDTTTAMR